MQITQFCSCIISTLYNFRSQILKTLIYSLIIEVLLPEQGFQKNMALFCHLIFMSALMVNCTLPISSPIDTEGWWSHSTMCLYAWSPSVYSPTSIEGFPPSLSSLLLFLSTFFVFVQLSFACPSPGLSLSRLTLFTFCFHSFCILFTFSPSSVIPNFIFCFLYNLSFFLSIASHAVLPSHWVSHTPLLVSFSSSCSILSVFLLSYFPLPPSLSLFSPVDSMEKALLLPCLVSRCWNAKGNWWRTPADSLQQVGLIKREAGVILWEERVFWITYHLLPHAIGSNMGLGHSI